MDPVSTSNRSSRPPLAAAALGLGGLTVGSMWLPWFRSGSAGRNSFAAFQAADLLGIEWITPLRVLWFLVPIVFLAAGLARLLGYRRLGMAGIVLVGAVLAVAGSYAWLAFGAQAGPAAAAATGACTTLLGVLGLRG